MAIFLNGKSLHLYFLTRKAYSHSHHQGYKEILEEKDVHQWF